MHRLPHPPFARDYPPLFCSVCFLFRTTLLRILFEKNLSRKAAPRSTDLQVSVKYISIKKNIKNLQLKKKIKTLPALPPPSNRYAQTAAPSSLPACATDLFLFRHFSLASPGKCQVNLLQKKEKQNTKHKEATALGALPLNLHQSTATRTDRRKYIHTQKKTKKNCTTLLGVEPSRDPRSPAEPGRAAGAGSALIVILYDKSGRHRTATSSLYVGRPLASVKCLSRG